MHLAEHPIVVLGLEVLAGNDGRHLHLVQTVPENNACFLIKICLLLSTFKMNERPLEFAGLVGRVYVHQDQVSLGTGKLGRKRNVLGS